MNLLLDTHTFVWWHDTPAKLSSTAFPSNRREPENEITISIVSAGKLQIKIALRKFLLKKTLQESIETELISNGFHLLPVSLPHIYNLATLPQIHGDPFDRLLISQAVVEDLTVITVDPKFSGYGVKILW